LGNVVKVDDLDEEGQKPLGVHWEVQGEEGHQSDQLERVDYAPNLADRRR